ncbi:type II secretion system protein N [Herminiimonas sp. CN]|uniref:type II secretion system protein N n=1 Tax=Herminiimonas sp. CN TaxID=1349818 RepID=UPI0004735DFF|nr:type II secretion system protein N [Herminiimonas sp. CN]
MLARISAIIVLAFTAVAGWALLRPVTLPAAHAPRLQDENWQLPQRQKIDIDSLILAIDDNKLWGTVGQPPAPANEKPLTPPNWRISGVFGVGNDGYLMLAVDGEPIKQLKTGDKLPGGATLYSIATDRICILLNGKKRILGIYKE